jgi:GDP-L-fucose synthase
MDKNAKIYVAGHRGLAGNAILRELSKQGYHNIVVRTHRELDLTNQNSANEFFMTEKPEYVFLCAARIGGIADKTAFPAEFIMNNLQIESNVITAAHNAQVKKLLFMGSSFAYPNDCRQPITEECLLTSLPGKTDEPYIIAKICGLKMCEYFHNQYGDQFFTVMPSAFFGANDNFDLRKATLIASMIKRMYLAKITHKKEFLIWGTGRPLRELLYVDDVAGACIYLMKSTTYLPLINVGNGGIEKSVAEIAAIIKQTIDYDGILKYDLTKPDGVERKVLDSSILISLGWRPQIDLEQGIRMTYEYFLENEECNLE